MQEQLFSGFNFNDLDSPEFKEDSVREVLIVPILAKLGYSVSGDNRITRSKKLQHPFVRIGRRENKVQIYPDYMLTVKGNPKWVLEAKPPTDNIISGYAVEQVYSYAIHPDVRVFYYALCNGRDFVVFRTDQDKALLNISLRLIDKHWNEIDELLNPEAFTHQAAISPKEVEQAAFDYSTCLPLLELSDLNKQGAKRHYGVHGYFTKQVWSVVRRYIENFTQPGDLVLDPFGGTGVTFIEAITLKRRAIHIDINPISVFIVKTLISPVSIPDLSEAYFNLVKEYSLFEPSTSNQIKNALNKYDYPKGIRLPDNSDVDTIEKLFSRKQLARLAYLKHLIMNIDNISVRQALLIMFSGLITKINLTYHPSANRSEGRGDSAVFRYYRYRLAPEPVELELMKYFESRLKHYISAKRELDAIVDQVCLNASKVIQGTATDLSGINSNSIDYIFTDPPYGSKIQYLDLSMMWNSWLDLPVTEADYELEAIEGGKLKKKAERYFELLELSIREMYRVLKFDRWMSFVYAHKDPSYWHAIVETAERVGFEYISAVRQSNDKTTFKKRQNPFTVLNGQLIINFRKVRSPKALMKISVGYNTAAIISETVENLIARNAGATLEEINDELVILGLELGFLDVLAREYQDITPLLQAEYLYDLETHKYHIKPNRKLGNHIDLNVRIKYYLLSYLRKMERQKMYPTFDDIVLNVMPLLKNGRTPEHQTILNVLETIAERRDVDRWKLIYQPQMSIFE